MPKGAININIRGFVMDKRGFTMNGLTAARPQEGAADSSNLSSPTARRVQIQSTWRQPKFVVGCALIVASVVMGALIVGAADDRVMWSATRDLAAGTVVTSDDLAEVAVAMDQAGRYLSSAQTSVLGRRTSRAIGGTNSSPCQPSLPVTSTPG